MAGAQFPAIAAATLAGSLMSCFATSCVLLSFAIYRRQMNSFRHALVLNLSFAEFVNSLNNSISGIIYVRDGPLQAGPACTVNGMVGQLSVQAGDFSILAIAVVTLLTVKRTVYMPDASRLKKVAICLAVWVVPLATSITATALGEMTVVGGNWCWISGSRPDLRYGLTHGWRFLVIFSTIAIYLYIWAYLRSQFKSTAGSQRWTYHSTTSEGSAFGPTEGSKGGDGYQPGPSIELTPSPQPNGGSFDHISQARSSHTYVGQPSPVHPEYFKGEPVYMHNADDDEATLDEMIHDRPARSLKHQRSIAEDIERITPSTPYQEHLAASSRRDVTATNRTSCSEFPIRRESHQAEREIKRMMLLNAYPIAYIILWIPGITNRLLEATGHTASARVAASLQVSTQFIGFANALTYGFNHHLRDRLKDMYVMDIKARLKRWRRG